MTTENSSPQVRYATLGDYLRVLRRYWIMILVVAAVGAVAGFAVAKGKSATYKATAELNFQDPLQNLSVVGLAGAQPQPPAQVAATASSLVTTPSVMDQVKRELRTSAPAQSLGNDVSAQVSIPSNLLQITATSPDPGFSAALANTTANVVAAQNNAQARAQFAHLASLVQGRIRSLSSHGATAFNSPELQFYESELGRLQTLASFDKTAQVVDRAAVPSAPSSTSTTRSALLGLLFGLLLGIVVAFVRDSLDRRLRDGKDVQSSFALPVLGHVRNRAMGRIVNLADSAGADRQVDIEAFRIVRRNLELLNPERPLKTIVVTSPVADEGKTTVAGSLAVAMASTGRSTLLLECDLRRPALASRLHVEQTPGLTDYLAGHVTPQEVLRTITFAEAPSGNGNKNGASANGHSGGVGVHRMVLIPSGSHTTHAAELIGSARFRELVEQVSDTYDAVIVDCAPLLPVSDTLEVLPHADVLVLCVRESQSTRDQAVAAKSALSRFPGLRAGVVVTGIKPRNAGDDVVYAHAYDYV